ALSDASLEVRKRAAWALGNSDLRQAPRALVALLSDKDPEMRELAAWSLFQIEDPSSIPGLEAALARESDKELQIAYIRALAAVGERSVDALKKLLESKDPEIRTIAVRALAGGNATGPWPRPWPQPRPFPH
ncbi:MAG TPA: HEAT repeat domain-containing protein, partial [Gemmatimonadaceae bacterium]|nr:HEAT repeat domain-containing protein [Gemmatimonadaceae bacterium]